MNLSICRFYFYFVTRLYKKKNQAKNKTTFLLLFCINLNVNLNQRTHLWTIVCFLRFLNVRAVTRELSLICFVGCGEGRFGPQCSFLCGHCLGGVVCNHVNGSCPAGCSKGWHGRYCNQSKCTVIKVSELNIANRLYDKVYNIWIDTKVTM